MVEFSLIAALVLLLVFGIIEISLIFLQEHFVANAAREGLRIGVRANNFICFDGNPADGCTPDTDRYDAVRTEIIDYLSTFYDEEDINFDGTPELGEDSPILTVYVETKNIFPSFITYLVKALPSDDGEGISNYPDKITFRAQMEYEDPEEYKKESN